MKVPLRCPEHLNTPRLVADASQNAVWKWDQQEPYGQNVANADPDGDNVQFEFNLRYPGQHFDRETSGHYNHFRDYDPSVGAFRESDLIGLQGGLNTYGYVAGNPLSTVDPSGLDHPGMGPYGDYWSGNYRFHPDSGPLTKAVAGQVECMSLCLGPRLGVPPPMLTITGGIEPRGARASLHPLGKAVDFGAMSNPKLTPAAGRKREMLDCACDCGFTHGGWEQDFIPGAKPHYHFQKGVGPRNVPKLYCGSCRR